MLEKKNVANLNTVTRYTSTKLKAAFLLMVFALNTVVGFACSMGMDMGFNTKHHDNQEATEAVVHVHNDGKKHVHQEKKETHSHNNSGIPGDELKAIAHVHKNGTKHIHQEKKESRSHDKSHKHDEENSDEKSKSNEGNCCTDNVKSFQDLDKSIPSSRSIIHPVFFTAFVAVYYNIALLPHTDVVKDIKPFVRSYHPPIPDIRIAIQSFQI